VSAQTPIPLRTDAEKIAELRRSLREQAKRHTKLMASACREIAGLKIQLELSRRNHPCL